MLVIKRAPRSAREGSAVDRLRIAVLFRGVDIDDDEVEDGGNGSTYSPSKMEARLLYSLSAYLAELHTRLGWVSVSVGFVRRSRDVYRFRLDLRSGKINADGIYVIHFTHGGFEERRERWTGPRRLHVPARPNAPRSARLFKTTTFHALPSALPLQPDDDEEDAP